MLSDSDKSKRINIIQQELMNTTTPYNFLPSSANNEIIKMDKSFRIACVRLEKANIKDPRNLSVFDYYTTIESLEQEHLKHNSKALFR